VAAIRVNHVSVRAIDIEASVRFYMDLFGARPIPTPDFGGVLRWLQLGENQLHIFQRGEDWDIDVHFALEVDDFETVYRKAGELGAHDTDGTWGYHIFALASGVVQMYLRDPAKNLVEVIHPSVDTLPPDIAAVVQQRTDKYPQTEESAKATFYTG
jgi:catechol 2,3-dioxygenase-like lactoylglutathione lyase family enzyme